MKKALLFITMCGLLASCLEKKETEEQAEPAEKPESFINEMPTNERDMLLGPLLGVMDDLKKSIEDDPSMDDASKEIALGDISGKLAYRVRGSDTAMVSITLGGAANLKERHAWYYDKDGNYFYSEHEILNIDFGFEEGPNHRQYKFYFDEQGAQLSAYAKVSFDGDPLPEKWTEVKLTKEEEQYLQLRLEQL